MKDKIFNSIIIIISLFVLLELFIKKKVIYSAILYALNIWVKVLIPSLFPFFIISDILINYNITSYIPRFFKSTLKKLFNISDNQITILLLSMISGFPSNARNTRTLYDNNLITLEEADHILMFSHFANPMFILTTIALFFFKNKEIGIILFISHYLSNMILVYEKEQDEKDRETSVLQWKQKFPMRKKSQIFVCPVCQKECYCIGACFYRYCPNCGKEITKDFD